MARFKDPVAVLRQEHRLLLVKLHELEKEVEYLESWPVFYDSGRIAATEDLLETLVKELTAHERKEEEAVFPVLRAAVDFQPLWAAIMLQDKEVRFLLPALMEAWRQWTTASWNSARLARMEFVKQAERLVQILREHIYEEESFLFGYADRHLTVSEKEDIARRMRELDKQPEVEETGISLAAEPG